MNKQQYQGIRLGLACERSHEQIRLDHGVSNDKLSYPEDAAVNIFNRNAAPGWAIISAEMKDTSNPMASSGHQQWC